MAYWWAVRLMLVAAGVTHLIRGRDAPETFDNDLIRLGIRPATAQFTMYKDHRLQSVPDGLLVVGSGLKLDNTKVSFVLQFDRKDNLIESHVLPGQKNSDWHKDIAGRARAADLPFVVIAMQLLKPFDPLNR